MRPVLRAAYGVYIAGHVMLAALLLGAVMLVGYEVPQAVNGRGQMAIYLAGVWLVRGAILGLLTMATILMLELDTARWVPIWHLVLRKSTPPPNLPIPDPKKRQVSILFLSPSITNNSP